MGSSGIVVVLDFDKTIIEVDSDNWVVDELGATALFDQLLPTMPWNSLMDRMMKELHARGKTVEEIKEVLRRVPIHPRIVQAIKHAHSLGCDMKIVSDANTVFIETIIEHVGLKECFTEINTNPSYIDEEGRLRICPYVDFNSSPHDCRNPCPPNMCKGMIIERIQAAIAKEGKKRMIYLGDGIGDFCPSLKLKERDFVMPRKGFPVWDLICENGQLLRAQVHEWSDGKELESVLLALIQQIMAANSSSPPVLSSFDWSFGTASVEAAAPPEALPKPLKVRH